MSQHKTAPVESLVKVSPFPAPRVTEEAVRLSDVVKGAAATVVHLYTG